MPPTCQVSAISYANKFPDHFFEDHGFLICNTKKKNTILDLVEAFVNANISLKKVDNLYPWLKNNLIDSGSILLAKCLKNSYLKPVYERHIVAIKLEFGNKPVSFIVDKTTDDCTKSVVNILFSYQNITKLVFVDFLNDINNIIVGQLILQTLIKWFIPFNTTRLFVSDSASEMWMPIAQFDLIKGLLDEIQQSVSRYKSQRSCYSIYLHCHGVEKLQKIPLYNKTRWSSYELENPSSSLIYEWSIYCNFELSTIEYNNLAEFWEKISEELPELSKIAQEYIWLLISSCAIEQSFSNYNNILANNRQTLSLDSLQMLNIMYFN
ncbi:transcription factor e2f6 [Gigaspora margarita]|uniref:Transcription factor e2f6 n=1 Tax=Gigaspora margarita TaxID=4874 RepID=A0A8H4A0Z1_GIGMA|nr:transcription factor e2f6 [Gigaspora margarita]